jgi:hypothetical protein
MGELAGQRGGGRVQAAVERFERAAGDKISEMCAAPGGTVHKACADGLRRWVA